MLTSPTPPMRSAANKSPGQFRPTTMRLQQVGLTSKIVIVAYAEKETHEGRLSKKDISSLFSSTLSKVKHSRI